jgi:copper chaperone NosL
MKYLTLLCLFLSLQGCGEKAPEKTDRTPIALSDDAIGHFCGMQVSVHDGPKGQVFLKGKDEPLWFVSVRDSLAYSRMPDEKFKISTIYVSDMGKAESWDRPGDAAWVRAEDAWYAVGSSRIGGMGMAEFVPFSDKAKAEDFVATYGGTLAKIDEIKTEALLGSDDILVTIDKDKTHVDQP